MSAMRLLQICVTANLGGFLAGVHLAIYSGILEMKTFAQEISNEDSLTALAKSVITIAYIFSFTLAAPIAGPFIDRIGRRNSLLLSACLFALSSSSAIFSHSISYVIATRFFAGIAYAMVNITCPMYTAEIAPASRRGMLVNLYQLSITIGILFAQLSNLKFAYGSWKGALTYSFIPAVITLTAVWLLVPESAAWLKSRAERSRAIDMEHGVATDASTSTTRRPITLLQLFRDPSARRRLIIGAGISAAQQWSGINAVIFFAPALVRDVLHWEGTNASLRAAAYVGLANVLATIASFLLVDRFGRRTLLLAGTSPMMVGLLALGCIKTGILAASTIIGISSLVTYVAAFATTYGPLPFVVCSEIFPVRYKGVGMSFCNAVLGVSSLLVGVTFLPLLESIGGAVYFMYMAFVAASGMFVWYMLPETQRMSLEEIDVLLEQNVESKLNR